MIRLNVISLAAFKKFTTGSAFLPLILIAKPNKIPNTNIATTFSLDSKPLKSSTLISLTVLSKKLSLSLTLSDELNIFSIETLSPESTKLVINVVPTPTSTATSEVIINTNNIDAIIFPSLFGLFIFAIVVVTVKNTKGTITTNIKLRNKSPKGLTISAFSLKIKPAIVPIIIEITKIIVCL